MPNSEDLAALRDFAEAEQVKPIIDTIYPLSETPNAVAAVRRGHAQGKTAIAVEQTSD